MMITEIAIRAAEYLGIYVAPGCLLCGFMAGCGYLENLCAVAAHRTGKPLTLRLQVSGALYLVYAWPLLLVLFLAGFLGRLLLRGRV